jgi:hypothetical protein
MSVGQAMCIRGCRRFGMELLYDLTKRVWTPIANIAASMDFEVNGSYAIGEITVVSGFHEPSWVTRFETVHNTLYKYKYKCQVARMQNDAIGWSLFLF